MYFRESMFCIKSYVLKNLSLIDRRPQEQKETNSPLFHFVLRPCVLIFFESKSVYLYEINMEEFVE